MNTQLPLNGSYFFSLFMSLFELFCPLRRLSCHVLVCYPLFIYSFVPFFTLSLFHVFISTLSTRLIFQALHSVHSLLLPLPSQRIFHNISNCKMYGLLNGSQIVSYPYFTICYRYYRHSGVKLKICYIFQFVMCFWPGFPHKHFWSSPISIRQISAAFLPLLWIELFIWLFGIVEFDYRKHEWMVLAFNNISILVGFTVDFTWAGLFLCPVFRVFYGVFRTHTCSISAKGELILTTHIPSACLRTKI